MSVDRDQILVTRLLQEKRGAWKDGSYVIRLDWTPCNYGGERPWFLCPAHGCGRRVAVLYGNFVFACRHCHRLAYPSQREADYQRAIRRADEIRDRLGWEPGIIGGCGLKPKGMHWRTFRTMVAKYDAFKDEALAGVRTRYQLNSAGKRPEPEQPQGFVSSALSPDTVSGHPLPGSSPAPAPSSDPHKP